MIRPHRLPDLLALAGVLAGVSVGTAPRAARAQMDLGPALPVGADLRKARVGSWAEYRMTFDGMPGAVTVRSALVGKTAAGYLLETAVSGGPVQGTMVMSVLMGADPSVAGAIKKATAQIAHHDPMEIPTAGQGAAVQRFEKPRPKDLVGEETLEIAGAKLKTKRYRTKTARGDTVDAWLSKDLHPLGLVKLQLKPGAGAPIGPMKQELVARGGGAKSVITKKPRPFDAAEMGKMLGGMTGTPRTPGRERR